MTRIGVGEQYVAEGSKPVDRLQGRCAHRGRLRDHRGLAIRLWTGRNASPPIGRSITEIEPAEAQACGKPVLAFLLDPEVSWPPNRVDAMGGVPGAGQDVSRLRALLGTDYLAGIFPNARRPGHPGRGRGVGPGADPPRY